LFTKRIFFCHIKRNSLQRAGGRQFANSCRHVLVRIYGIFYFQQSPEICFAFEKTQK